MKASWRIIAITFVGIMIFGSCTQETQNKIGRSIQNWTGTDGVLEVYSGGKMMKRFMNIDKLSTASGTQGGDNRPYRYGYGCLDVNLNGKIEPNEKKKVYFEISDFSTQYVFFENPQ